jgi:hypothetical protein
MVWDWKAPCSISSVNKKFFPFSCSVCSKGVSLYKTDTPTELQTCFMKTTFFLFFATALLLTACSKQKESYSPYIPPISGNYLTGTWVEKDTSIQNVDSHSNYTITFRGDSFFLNNTFWTSTFIGNSWVSGTYSLISDSLRLFGNSTDSLYHPIPPLLNTFHETSFFRYRNQDKFVLTYPASNSFWARYRYMVRRYGMICIP